MSRSMVLSAMSSVNVLIFGDPQHVMVSSFWLRVVAVFFGIGGEKMWQWVQHLFIRLSFHIGNRFASHKYGGISALRYELGIDILSGNLIWIDGSYDKQAMIWRVLVRHETINAQLKFWGIMVQV